MHAIFSRYVFCLLFVLCYLEAVSAEEDTTTNRSLRKLFNEGEIAKSLHATIQACHNESAKLDAETCRSYEYIAAVHTKNEWTRGLKAKSAQVSVISKANSNLRYSQIFQDFAAKQLPFQGSISGSHGLDSCPGFSGRDIDSITEDTSLATCPQRDSIVVPYVLGNNYLLRLSSSSNIGANAAKEIESVKYLSQWPAVMSLPVGEPTTVRQCPMGLHQLVLNAAPSPTSTLKIRLFSSTAAMEFDPHFGSDADSNAPLHHVTYGLSGFPKLFESKNKAKNTKGGTGGGYSLPKFTEVSLKPNEYLMIPNSLLTSLLFESGAETGTGTVLRYCFVDASNVNTFRQELAATMALSPQNAFIYQQLLNTTLVGMNLSPQDTVVGNVASVIPAPEQQAQSLDQRPPAEGEDVAAPSPPVQAETVSRSRGNRRRGGDSTASTTAAGGTGSSDAKTADSTAAAGAGVDWQEAKRWQGLIKSLTLPPPHQPYGVGFHHDNITLAVVSAYSRDPNDVATAFGVDVLVCPSSVAVDAHSDESLGTSIPVAPAATENADGEVNTVEDNSSCSLQQLLLSKTSPREVREYRVPNDGSPDMLESPLQPYASHEQVLLVEPHHLRPSSAYRMRVRYRWGDARGAWSAWSETLHTAPKSGPSPIPTLAQLKQLLATSSKQPSAQAAQPGGRGRKRGLSQSHGAFLEHNRSVIARLGTYKMPEVLDLIFADKFEDTVDLWHNETYRPFHNQQHTLREGTPVVYTGVLLHFLRPFDANGGDVRGYYVRARFALPLDIPFSGEARFGPWVRQATLTLTNEEARLARAEVVSGAGDMDTAVVAVLHLPLDSGNGMMAAQFEVAAVNAYGVGGWSESSNLLQLQQPAVSTDETSNEETSETAGRTEQVISSIVRGLPDIDEKDLSVVIGLHYDRQTISAFNPHDPLQEQLVQLPAWRCHWGPQVSAMGAPAWVDPITVHTGDITNSADLGGRVAFTMRGVCPLVHKVLRLQAAKAVAVVIVDDGSCNGSLDQSCLPGADRSFGEGFAKHDVPQFWQHVKLPVMFVNLADAVHLLRTFGQEIPADVMNSLAAYEAKQHALLQATSSEL